MKSPCINVCELDEENKCKGCGRTLQEIIDWGSMSEEEREKVLERLDNE